MANIKSAEKRVQVSQKRAERNKSVKSKVKTYTKKVTQAVESGDRAAAETALRTAVSEIDKAAAKGVFHDNKASRKVARLSKAVSSME